MKFAKTSFLYNFVFIFFSLIENSFYCNVKLKNYRGELFMDLHAERLAMTLIDEDANSVLANCCC